MPETLSASTLFRDMQQKKVHLAVVVDEYGQTSGIITMEDLVEEVVVGNIYDEFDPAEPTEIEAIESKPVAFVGQCGRGTAGRTVRAAPARKTGITTPWAA